jgi:hypothetical protein
MAALDVSSPLLTNGNGGIDHADEHAASPEIRKQIATDLIAMSMSSATSLALVQRGPTSKEPARSTSAQTSPNYTDTTTSFSSSSINSAGSRTFSQLSSTAAVEMPGHSAHQELPVPSKLPNFNRRTFEQQYDSEIADMDPALPSAAVEARSRVPLPLSSGRGHRQSSAPFAYSADDSGFMAAVAAPHAASRSSMGHHQSPSAIQQLEALDAEEEATRQTLSPSHRRAIKANNPTPTKLWQPYKQAPTGTSPGAPVISEISGPLGCPSSPPRSKIRPSNRAVSDAPLGVGSSYRVTDDIMNSPAAIKVDDVIYGRSNSGNRADSSKRTWTDFIDDEVPGRRQVPMLGGSIALLASAGENLATEDAHRVPKSPYRVRRLHDATEDDQELDASPPSINPHKSVSTVSHHLYKARVGVAAASTGVPTSVARATTVTKSTASEQADLFSPFSRFVHAALSATSPELNTAQSPDVSATTKTGIDGLSSRGPTERRAHVEPYHRMDRPSSTSKPVRRAYFAHSPSEQSDVDAAESDPEEAEISATWPRRPYFRGDVDSGYRSQSPSSRGGDYSPQHNQAGFEFQPQRRFAFSKRVSEFDAEDHAYVGRQGRGNRISEAADAGSEKRRFHATGKSRSKRTSTVPDAESPQTESAIRIVANKARGASSTQRQGGAKSNEHSGAPLKKQQRAAAVKAAQATQGRVYTARQVSAGPPGTSPISLAVALDPPAVRHQTTCHRCTSSHPENVRVYCVACPACWCAACARRAIQMFGLSTFDDGCPKCKRLCCCLPFANNVMPTSRVPPPLMMMLNGLAKSASAGKKMVARSPTELLPAPVDSSGGTPSEGTHFCLLPLHCRNCRLRPAVSAIGVDPISVEEVDVSRVHSPPVRTRHPGLLDANSELLPGLDHICDYVSASAHELGSAGVSAGHNRLEYQYVCTEKDAGVIVNDFLAGGDMRRARVERRLHLQSDAIVDAEFTEGLLSLQAAEEIEDGSSEPARKKARLSESPDESEETSAPLPVGPAAAETTSPVVPARSTTGPLPATAVLVAMRAQAAESNQVASASTKRKSYRSQSAL